MRRKISLFILKITGWTITGNFPDLKKAVVIVAPHTSMWDWIWGRLFFFAHKKSTFILINEKYFFFPLGWLLRATGGFPVPRSRNPLFMPKLLNYFKKQDDIYLTITPEGTRKSVNRWETGFYRIAQAMDLPIVLGYIDYKSRTMGTGPIIHISENKDDDLNKIFDFYSGIVAKHPEKFNIPKDTN